MAANLNRQVGDAAAGEVDGDRITFDPSLANQTISIDFGLAIRDDLEISGTTSGGDVTLKPSRTNTSLVQVLTSEGVTLEGLTLTGVDNAYRGGAVRVGAGNSLSMSNVAIVGNRAVDGAGVIIMRGGTLIGSHLDFEQNHATATNTSDGNGGAIFVATDGRVRIDGSSNFRENSAEGNGGAINAANRAGIQLTSNINLDRNTADNGGAIWTSRRSDVLLENDVHFDGNHATNAETGEGGSLRIGERSSLRFDGGSVRNSTAMHGGGGLLLAGEARVDIYEVTFRQNESGSSGGAISIRGDDNRVMLQHSDFFDNIAGRAGGAISQFGVDESQSDNGVVLISGGDFIGNSSGLGGAIYTVSRELKVLSTARFQRNASNSSGGAIFSRSEKTLISAAEIGGDLASDGNTAGHNGGGVYVGGGESEITNGTSIKNNVAGSEGGGVAAFANTKIRNGVKIEENVAMTRSSETLISGGGGILNVGNMVVENGVRISGNEAPSGDGGGIFTRFGELRVYYGSLIKGNTAKFRGGGVFASSGALIVGNSTIRENSTTSSFGSGGGVFIANTLGISRLTNHTRVLNNTSAGNGGGILHDGGRLLIDRRATITQNSAAGNGGGLFVSITPDDTEPTSLTIEQAVITYNTAADGGGIFAEPHLNANLTGNRIEGNTPNETVGV